MHPIKISSKKGFRKKVFEIFSIRKIIDRESYVQPVLNKVSISAIIDKSLEDFAPYFRTSKSS